MTVSTKEQARKLRARQYRWYHFKLMWLEIFALINRVLLQFTQACLFLAASLASFGLFIFVMTWLLDNYERLVL